MAAASSLKLTKYPEEEMIQQAGPHAVCHFHLIYLRDGQKQQNMSEKYL